MKTPTIILAAVGLLALSTTSFAKGKKGAPAPTTPTASEVIAKYDKNSDSKLDEAELTAFLNDQAAAAPTKKKKKNK